MTEMKDLIRRMGGDFYRGDENNHQADGEGTLTLYDGTIYEGSFKDGVFHGEGKLIFTDGSFVQAIWKFGRLQSGTYIFEDGLTCPLQSSFSTYSNPEIWEYCTEKDRRFWSEHVCDLPASVNASLSDSCSSHVLPFGCYDVGDGYYCPEESKVFTFEGIYLRDCCESEAYWAKTKCCIGKDRSIQHESSVTPST